MESPTELQTEDLDSSMRANKKLKQHQLHDHMASPNNINDMEMQEKFQNPVGTEMSHEWGSKTFSKALRDQDPTEEAPTHFYMGEDTEESFEGVDALFLTTNEAADGKLESPKQVEISKDKYLSLFNPWRGALILKLLGKSVSFRVLEQRTSELWKLKWGYELIDLEGGFFLARFFTRDNYLKALEGGPWIIMGHYLTVTKWRPNFRPSMKKVSTTAIWICFPELPIELFDEEILHSMGDTIGKTVKVDATTVDASRGRYVRVCVKVDLNAPLVPMVLVLGSPQRVEYEGLHLICFECGRYGHKQDECSSVQPQPPPTTAPTLAPGLETNFGPWMLPKESSSSSACC